MKLIDRITNYKQSCALLYFAKIKRKVLPLLRNIVMCALFLDCVRSLICLTSSENYPLLYLKARFIWHAFRNLEYPDCIDLQVIPCTSKLPFYDGVQIILDNSVCFFATTINSEFEPIASFSCFKVKHFISCNAFLVY